MVASPQPDASLESIAHDFAQCAYWAKEAGAQVIEANLSCPNVCTSEGQLYTSPEASWLVSQAIRHAVGNIPVVLKIGLFGSAAEADSFVGAVSEYTDALSTTNSISASVVQGDSTLFDGLTRGIGGACIRDRCLEEVRMLSALIANRQLEMKLIGVGGVVTAGDVLSRLQAGDITCSLRPPRCSTLSLPSGSGNSFPLLSRNRRRLKVPNKRKIFSPPQSNSERISPSYRGKCSKKAI